jgi:hypothetical protein
MMNYFKTQILIKNTYFNFKKLLNIGLNCFSTRNSTTPPVLNKFVKIDKNLPTEEENLDLLLNEMRSEKIETASNLNYIQKGGVVFLSSDLVNKIKLGEFLKINKNIFAQCVSIKENLITLFIININAK